jgi:hypothetical protein
LMNEIRQALACSFHSTIKIQQSTEFCLLKADG